MAILCDTCCVLLLIRIAPDMFIDERYNCFTVQEVREEIFQTQRFKSKYPWRNNFKRELTPKQFESEIVTSASLCFDVISKKIESGTLNERNNRFFDLGYKDKKIVAYALASKSTLATNDNDMRDFIEQEFDGSCISSLELLNQWLRYELFEWNSELHAILDNWNQNDEPVQPTEDIVEFERLTKFKYVGP